MWKLSGARVADLAHRAKGHLRTAYHSAVKWGGHLDNLMKAGRIAGQILAPHISEGATKSIGAGLSKYEQVHDQARAFSVLVHGSQFALLSTLGVLFLMIDRISVQRLLSATQQFRQGGSGDSPQP